MYPTKLPELKWPNSLLSGGNVMGKVILEHDWTGSALGPMEKWPGGLISTLTTAMGSRFPTLIFWGADFNCLYNDGYAVILGDKKDIALGSPFKEVLPEAWDSLYGMLKEVLSTGKGSWAEDQIYFLVRNGYPEESYFTFSFARILDEVSGEGGISCSAIETTGKVLSDRRLKTLQEISNESTDKGTAEEAALACVRALSTNPLDIPFFGLYWLEKDSRKGKLIGSKNADLPPLLPVDHPIFAEAFQIKNPVLMDKLSPEIRDIQVPPGLNIPTSLYVMPIQLGYKEEVSGFLVVGISAHQPFNEEYKSFFRLIITQIQTVITSALAQENANILSQELAKVDRAKTAFFSNISHEFRTPLTLLLGPLEEALQTIQNDQAIIAKEDLESAHRNAIRLLKLVNSLLDFSRVEAGRVDAHFEATDLSRYTKELVAQFETVFERGGVALEVGILPLNGFVNVDRELWEKILFNLLSNAFKFTFEGKVVVSLYELENFIHLTVKDSGTGIPEEEISKIFQRFHRVQGSLSRSFEGSGIGLALVKEMSKLHGGTVSVESVYGEGSTFTVSLPKDRHYNNSDNKVSNSIAPSLRHTTAAFLSEANLWLADPALDPVSLSNFGQHRKATVLIIDDNADMRAYLARILSQNYLIETAKNGLDALAFLENRLPELIITDVMMPGLDGFGLLKQLRSQDRTRLLPVIMLSARAGDNATVEGLEAGADEYLIKPFSPRELLARVKSLLAMSNLRRDLEAERKTIASLAEVQRLSQLLDASPDHVFMLDREGRYVYHNKAACEALAADLKSQGREVESTIGKTLREIGTDSKFLKQFEAHQAEALLGHSVTGEVLVPSTTGLRQYEYILSPSINNNEAGIKYLVGISRDVDELMVAVKAREEFITIASHELKTPLTSLLMFAQVQKHLINKNSQQAFAKDNIIKLVDHTERQAIKLNLLVESMLDLSRFKSGKYDLHKTKFGLLSLTKDLIERMSVQFLSAGCGLPEVEGPEVFGLWDSLKIEQVLSNLLVNALKYGAGSLITVTIEKTETTAKVSVTDRGLGIPAEDQLRIFLPFERAISSDEVSGLGLGLYIVKQIIEAHDGRIRVMSEKGKGAKFTFEIPLGDA